MQEVEDPKIHICLETQHHIEKILDPQQRCLQCHFHLYLDLVMVLIFPVTLQYTNLHCDSFCQLLFLFLALGFIRLFISGERSDESLLRNFDSTDHLHPLLALLLFL